MSTLSAIARAGREQPDWRSPSYPLPWRPGAAESRRRRRPTRADYRCTNARSSACCGAPRIPPPVDRLRRGRNTPRSVSPPSLSARGRESSLSELYVRLRRRCCAAGAKKGWPSSPLPGPRRACRGRRRALEARAARPGRSTAGCREFVAPTTWPGCAKARAPPWPIGGGRTSRRASIQGPPRAAWLDRALPQIGAVVSRLVRTEDTAARLSAGVFGLACPPRPARPPASRPTGCLPSSVAPLRR